jgi:hypothetical protein
LAEAGERLVTTGWGFVRFRVADPDFAASSVEVAVMVAVPAAVGAKIPPDEIVPPVAVHVTAEL